VTWLSPLVAQRCANQAAAWLDDPNSVVMDFETTGLDGYAVEVAITDMNGEELLSRRVNPGRVRVAARGGGLDDWVPITMHPKAEAVHGIRLDDLRDCPLFMDLVELDVLHGVNVVAYNAPFDRSVWLRETYRWRQDEDRMALDSPPEPKEWRCAMRLYSEWVGGRDAPWMKLPGGDHTALGDCRATVAVLRRVAGRT